MLTEIKMTRDLGERERKIFNSLVSTHEKDILEIGCGAGYFSEILVVDSHYLCAIDVDTDNVEKTKQKLLKSSLKVSCVQASGEDLSQFVDNSFDLVVFPYSLHHHNNPELALQEAFRVVKASGMVVVIEPKNEGDYCQFLLPVYNEEAELLFVNNLLSNLVCAEKNSQLYSVDWLFDSLQDLRQMIIDKYNPPMAILEAVLNKYQGKSKIIIKDSAVIWLLKE